MKTRGKGKTISKKPKLNNTIKTKPKKPSKPKKNNKR